jgi:glyoxylase-like metal-dependent hydrolase (beta-lactamase superfamily II)
MDETEVLALSDYVSSRRVGDAVVSIITEGVLEWTPRLSAPEDEVRRAIPELSATGTLLLDINLAHVSLGKTSMVIDPGCDDPASAWQNRFAAKWSGMRRSPGMAKALAGIGIHPADVTHVVITHAHADHFAGVVVERGGRDEVRFPHARHIIMRQDWSDNPARRDKRSELADRLGAVERLGLLEVLEHEREVLPGVTVIPAPGETPGHAAVRVISSSARFYYLGDLFHHPAEVEHAGWVPPNRDAAAARESRRRLSAEAASSDALVVFSHERFPPWGRIRRSDGGYRWERDRAEVAG